MIHKNFGDTDLDKQIIENLKLTQDAIDSQNVPIKRFFVDEAKRDFAFGVSEMIHDERQRIKEEIKKATPEIPYWEQTGNVTQQVRKFY